MINAEKHKNELRTLYKLKKLCICALRKDNGAFGNCSDIGCKNCVFDDYDETCGYARMKWMLSEYREPVKLSRLEYEFLKRLEKGGYKYIVRSQSGNLMTHDSTPKKAFCCWVSENGYKNFSSLNELLHFIKWEDEEPTSIQDVLDNCEVVDDD